MFFHIMTWEKTRFCVVSVVTLMILVGLCESTGNTDKVTPEIANSWAERILKNIHHERHLPIYKKLNDPITLRNVEAMRDNLINKYKGKPEAKLLEKLTAKAYLKKLGGYIDGWKEINTAAVMVVADKIYVAGNVKTNDLPADPVDLKLFKTIAFDKEPARVSDNFQIQDTDAPAIKRSLDDPDLKRIFDGKNPEVFVVTPDGHGLEEANYQAYKKEVWEKQYKKLEKKHLRNIGGLNIETQTGQEFVKKSHGYKALKTEDLKAQYLQKKGPSILENQVQRLEGKFKKEVLSAKKDFDKVRAPSLDKEFKVKNAHTYHAEMQELMALKDLNLRKGEKAIFGVSKSLCEKCEIGLKDSLINGKPGDSVIEYAQHDKPGRRAGVTDNWEHPNGVKVTDLSEMEKRAKASMPDDVELKSIDVSGCTRRKRSASSSCGHLNSKEFVKEYANGDEKVKKRLAESSRKNSDVDIVGNAEDVKKVKSLGNLESVKSRNKATITTKLKTKGSELWSSIKKGTGNVRTKISQTKLAKKIQGLTQAKTFKRVSLSVNLASAPIGLFLLGKSVVHGIKHKDYTTLGIVAGRVGIEAVEWTARGTSVLAKKGSILAKRSTLIGRVAGPIGIAADIGLSIWSLSNAVGRFHSAEDKFDRKDAIADIIGSTVDIAITTAVVAATLLFPPAGIVIAVVGIIASFATQLAVSLFKTQNEIDRINSEVPLLGFEKSEQFSSRFMDWFGTRKKDYIDHLVATKKLNDLYIKHNVEFLKNNTEISGIAFPARSTEVSGSCRFVKRYCGLKNAWGCTGGFHPDQVLATDCDKGQRCSGYDCTDYYKSTDWLSYEEFECICDQTSNVREGYPRLNNIVHFDRRRYLYHERAVQKGVEGANFKCRPGHENYQGFRISEGSQTYDYLCEGTIALYQERYRGGRTFYFDLEEGNDKVFLDETSGGGNTFIIQNGRKYFVAGRGEDDFIIHPNCTSVSGTLRGGGGTGINRIILSDGLLKGKTLMFNKDVITSTGSGIDLRSSGINEIMGRPGGTEKVYPSCTVNKVQLRGSTSMTDPDFVHVDGSCPENKVLSIISEANTKIVTDNVRRTMQIIAHPGNSGQNFLAELSVAEGQESITVFIMHKCSELLTFKYSENSNEVVLDWVKTNTYYSFNIKIKHSRGVKIAFVEGESGYSSLEFGNGKTSMIHSLSSIGSLKQITRLGAPFMPNTFVLQSGNWNVQCNSKGLENNFILYSGFHQGSICCDSLTKNTLSLHESHVTEPFIIDFAYGYIGYMIPVSGIRNFIGRKNLGDTVTCGCDTEYIATNGGSFQNPDRIKLPSQTCGGNGINKDLYIISEGVTIFEDSNVFNRMTIVNIIDNTELNFTANTYSQSNVVFNIFLSDLYLTQNLKDRNVNEKSNVSSAQAHLIGKYGQVLDFQVEDNTPNGILPGPQILLRNSESEYNGHLILDTVGNARAVHFLHNNDGSCKTYKGIQGLANIFKIVGPCWNVQGASDHFSSNVFVLEVNSNQTQGIHITGGRNSENTLLVEKYGSDLENYISFDFVYDRIGESFTRSGRLENIQHFHGREAGADEIKLTCSSTILSINGRGGAKGKPDIIKISSPTINTTNCDRTIQVAVVKDTRVENSDKFGKYLYNIEIDSGIDTVKFIPTEENHHILQYRFLPGDVVTGAHYSNQNETMYLIFGFGDEFTLPTKFHNNGLMNPEIKFISIDESVTCEIIVDSENGDVNAKWDIRGTPIKEFKSIHVTLNKFLVNISDQAATATSDVKMNGQILDTHNEFYLVSLPETSSFQILGSGFDDLHLSDEFLQSKDLIVDLYEEDSKIMVSENDERLRLVGRMTGIKRYFGRVNGRDTVKPGCDTSLVKNADVIILDPDNCDFNFDIDMIIHPGTEVQLLDKNITLIGAENDTEAMLLEVGPAGDFRYHFEAPLSFTPIFSRRNSEQFLFSNHTYLLPVFLGDLESIRFYPWNDTLTYEVKSNKGLQIQHQMLTVISGDDLDEFYRQPKFVTNENCEIRVMRTWEILVLCQNISSSGDLDIPETSKRLGISIILQHENEITYAGNNLTDDRNVLTTSNLTNHLHGGGALDTIYQIKYLEKDVFISSGFSCVSEIILETAKHTIDLTDIIVPLRHRDSNKYVPKVETNQSSSSDLIIFLPEYLSEFPGKITIVNGVVEASLFQIVLNSAVMELKPVGGNRTREKREVEHKNVDNAWALLPKPIVIEPGTVYSLSQEDLEDGHSISLEGGVMTEINLTQFKLSRDGLDLHMSDVLSVGQNDESEIDPTVIVISDYFSKKGRKTEEEEEIIVPAINLSINLPGLEFEVPITTTRMDEIATEEIESWDQVLEIVEEHLLHDMPEVPRVFKIERGFGILEYTIMATSLLILCILSCFLIVAIKRKYRWSFYLKVSDSNSDDEKMKEIIRDENEDEDSELLQVFAKGAPFLRGIPATLSNPVELCVCKFVFTEKIQQVQQFPFLEETK